MNRISAVVVVALFGLCAQAEPRQCLGTGGSLLIVDETLGISLNPDGFENQLKTTLCQPLIKRPGIMFDYSSWDIGVFNYVSPIYDQQGITVGFDPISILELRVDASALGYWTVPADSGGYFAFQGYSKHYTEQDLPERDARTAKGANVTFSARLQGELPVFNDTLVITNTFQVDYFYVGDAPYYYNARRDVVLARSDFLLKNISNLMLKVALSRTASLQFGVQDDFTYVPGSNYVANVIGAFFSVPIRREGTLRDIEPFLRLGTYTHHAFRTGFQMQLGISIAWGIPIGKKGEAL